MARVNDRWMSIALSVLLHAALLGALLYGWLRFRQPPRPAPTLAIEARVVDARTLQGAPAKPAEPTPPTAAEPPAEPEGPPQPTPEELAAREQQRQQEEAATQQRLAEQQAAAAAAAEAARREAEQRAAAERKEREAAEAKARAAEEQQRQAAAKEQSEREEDLQRDLAEEEQARRARAGPALASWQSQIAAKINRNWLRPPTARAGIECMLNVTQVPGGEVTEVSIGECNGDQAVRESIEAAVYRASPLPPPPDPALFDRHLRIDFKPD
ncbi:MAG TPA: cell envelope integrity protein TolA [Steroidobacteraceae bacterium]|nr:cell envelope integrity protein TolA [Steroidobacteraceae bacterium]